MITLLIIYSAERAEETAAVVELVANKLHAFLNKQFPPPDVEEEQEGAPKKVSTHFLFCVLINV